MRRTALLLAASAAAAAWPGAARAQEACVACHSRVEAKIEVMGRIRSVRIDVEAMEEGAHGGFTCDICHTQEAFTSYPHVLEDGIDAALEEANYTCSQCHEEIAEELDESIHAGTLVCSRCHNPHIPAPEPLRAHVQDVCVQCHDSRYATFLDTYHGKATVLGRIDVARCTDCHGAHIVLPESDPNSTVSEQHRLETCRICHPDASPNFADFRVHTDASSREAPTPLYVVAFAYRLLIFTVFGFGGLHALAYLWRGVRGGSYRRRSRRD